VVHFLSHHLLHLISFSIRPRSWSLLFPYTTLFRSAASAAATLASVMVGYTIIIGETADGEPIRLLNDHVLNGSILLILVSCTISSFVSMSSGQKIADVDKDNTVTGKGVERERILLPINNEQMTEKMVNLGLLIKTESNKEGIFALNIINEDKKES